MLSEGAADALTLYSWPGNVRELERLIERAVALAENVRHRDRRFPPIVRGDVALVLVPSLQHHETMRTWGSRYARLVLNRGGGNKREASRVLGISYHTLVAYLRYPGRNSAIRTEAPSPHADSQAAESKPAPTTLASADRRTHPAEASPADSGSDAVAVISSRLAPAQQRGPERRTGHRVMADSWLGGGGVGTFDGVDSPWSSVGSHGGCSYLTEESCDSDRPIDQSIRRHSTL